MSFLDILYFIVPSAIFYAAPLILVAIGGVFSERSGVVNIALEGIMVIGAATGIITTLTLTNMGLGGLSPWISLLVAMVVGALFSLFLAVPSTVQARRAKPISASPAHAAGACSSCTAQRSAKCLKKPWSRN